MGSDPPSLLLSSAILLDRLESSPVAIWETIAPVRRGYRDDTGVFARSVSMGHGVFLGRKADGPSLDLENLPSYLGEQRRQQDIANSDFIFWAEYRAEALGSEQKLAVQQIMNAAASFWLVAANRLWVGLFVNVEHHSSGRYWRGFETYPHMPTPSETAPYTAYAPPQITVACSLFAALGGNPSVVGSALRRALSEGNGTMRFVNLWIVLEALFGPESPRRVSSRIAKRAAAFLEPPASAPGLVVEIRDAYALRSKIVHGLRGIDAVPDAEKRGKMLFVESLVRRSLTKILLDGGLTTTFLEGTDREEYLESLAPS